MIATTHYRYDVSVFFFNTYMNSDSIELWTSCLVISSSPSGHVYEMDKANINRPSVIKSFIPPTFTVGPCSRAPLCTAGFH